MSKTAAEWTGQAKTFVNKDKKQDAIECCDQAIAIDPMYGEAYFYKAYCMPKGTEEQKSVLYEKAIETGYANSSVYQNLGNCQKALDGFIQPHTAIDCYLKAIKLDESKSFLWLQIGLLYEQMGDKEQAMKYYDLCFEKEVDILNARLYKGKLLAQSGKYEEALQHLDAALTVTPDHIELLYQTGTVYRALGQTQKALELYDKAVYKDPQTPSDWCFRGLAFLGIDLRGEGLDDLAKTLKELDIYDKTTYSFDYVKFLKMTLRAVLQGSQLEDKIKGIVSRLDHEKPVMQEFNTVLGKLQDDKQKVQSKLLSQLCYQQTVESYLNIAEFDELKAEFIKILREIDVPANLRPKTSSEWVKEAFDFGNQRRLEEAVECCNQAITVDPLNGEAYCMKGLYLPQTTFAEKTVLFEKALETGYINHWTYQNLGACYMVQDRLQDSIHCVLKVIELDPAQNFLWAHVGLLYEQMGNKDEAMKYYDLCLEKNIVPQGAALYKGRLLAKEGKYEEALKCAEVGLAAWPIHIELHTLAGNVCRALGLEEKSVSHYNQAIKINPENPSDLCNQGLALIALNKREEGLTALRKMQKMLETTEIVYSPAYLKFMKATLNSILEAEELDTKTEAIVKNLESEKPETQEFKVTLEKLRDDKVKVQNKLIDQLPYQQSGEGNQNIDEFWQLKEQFNKKLKEIEALEKESP